MKTMMILAAVFAAGLMMITGCSTCCHKDGTCTKQAMKCDGSCCKEGAACAMCCTNAAGGAACCKK